MLGDLSFSLPENLGELQDILGGIGGCVSVGYSLIDLQEAQSNIFLFFFFFSLLFTFFFFFFLPKIGVPTASLTFYAINCTNGEWYPKKPYFITKKMKKKTHS